MNFGVVLVTYNRLDKLKIALECYEKQTYLPKQMIIIDNCSNDGTKEYLDMWGKKDSKFKKTIVHLDKNTGGSGGFYEGLKRSLKLNLDYVWVSDDDAFPKNDCFEIANNWLLKNKDLNISAICGTVINRGKIDVIHRRTLKPFLFIPFQFTIPKRKYSQESFKLNLFTYVGTFLNVKKLKKAGLTKKGYFIYCDDTEHSFRMSKYGNIYCIPKIEIVHDGPLNNGKDGVNWKLYYGIRNSMDFIKSNLPKRYYYFYRFYFRIKYYLMTLLLWKNKKAGFKLINDALKAGAKNQTGLDNTYKPGWKPQK